MSDLVREAVVILQSWSWLDTRIVLIAGLAAMACALPGNFLLVRRQSMMGDALSHTVLPGIVIAFLLAHSLKEAGWLTEATYDASRHAIMFTGALVLGVLTAVLTEWVQKLGKVEGSAALGVVFTTLFALGVLLLRAHADGVDLDPDCILYGIVEAIAYDASGAARAAAANGTVLLLTLAAILLLYKELRLIAFDPKLATTLGINARLMHYALMALTAATVVSAFESVGSILVIAMLIAPPATAYLLTDRLGVMIALSLVIAALSALLGHVLALIIPPLLFSRLGFVGVSDASTAGMIAAASGLLLTTAMLLAPRYGIISKFLGRLQLTLRIAREDLLGALYRFQEQGLEEQSGRRAVQLLRRITGLSPLLGHVLLWKLAWEGKLVRQGRGYQLTPVGREQAAALVRGHRLWETYMARHFSLGDEQIHRAAERAEHYLGARMRERLADELDAPAQDPHGRQIPQPETAQSNHSGPPA